MTSRRFVSILGLTPTPACAISPSPNIALTLYAPDNSACMGDELRTPLNSRRVSTMAAHRLALDAQFCKSDRLLEGSKFMQLCNWRPAHCL
jgi:hypothetical protein